VRVSNDKVARVRRISQTADGDKVHLDGEAMGRVLDAWNDGGTAEARAEAAEATNRASDGCAGRGRRDRGGRGVRGRVAGDVWDGCGRHNHRCSGGTQGQIVSVSTLVLEGERRIYMI